MSTIRCIYREAAPEFPATDQHPDAVRYGPITLDGGAVVFVDAIGGLPTSFDLSAVLYPPAPVPATITDRQFFQQLAVEGTITPDEALAAVKTGTLPAALSAIVAGLPSDQQFGANMLLCGAVTFHRDAPLTAQIGQSSGRSSAQLDDFFRKASAL